MASVIVDNWEKLTQKYRITGYKTSITLYELQKRIIDLDADLQKKDIDLKIEEQQRRLHDLENNQLQ